MLQAYGLKQYCNKIGIRAEIVCYEPPFLTGRHWWIPYVRKLCQKNITSVIDPVFLLSKAEWRKIEKKSGKKGYLFVYMTEYNQESTDFARKLAKDRKLPVIEVKKGKKRRRETV